MAKDGGDAVAAYTHKKAYKNREKESRVTFALDVHEEGVGSLDQTLLLVHGLLLSSRRVEQVGD